MTGAQINNALFVISLYFVTAELKMDVLREREVKDNLERQLLDEQKMRGKIYLLLNLYILRSKLIRNASKIMIARKTVYLY